MLAEDPYNPGPGPGYVYPPGAQCKMVGCSATPVSKWLCTKHESRLRRNGDPEIVKRRGPQKGTKYHRAKKGRDLTPLPSTAKLDTTAIPNLRAVRESFSLPQRSFGRLCGVSLATIQKVEAGEEVTEGTREKIIAGVVRLQTIDRKRRELYLA